MRISDWSSDVCSSDLLDTPRHGCLNVHASLLPRWRGAAPIQRAILAGDAETGVGIMQMEAGLDTGPVRLEARTRIGGKTAGVLTEELSIRSEEHTSELQSLMRISYAVFCLKKKKNET